ncbi:MAG: hypothetical protein HRU19_14475 [Pseudobacteriovorax sp.]|nr:hypothetical protein [Pseudobacteriovorax sp.]
MDNLNRLIELHRNSYLDLLPKSQIEQQQLFFQNKLEALLDKAQVKEIYKDRVNGKTLGYGLISSYFHPYYQETVDQLHFDCDITDSEAQEWMLRWIHTVCANKTVITEIRPSYFPLYQRMYPKLALENVVFAGNVSDSLEAWDELYSDKLSRISDSEYSVKRVRSSDLEQIFELKQSIFSKQSEFNPYFQNKAFREEAKKRYLYYLDHSLLYKVVKKGIIYGFFGAFIDSDHPLWGTSAGLEFAFDTDLQGKYFGVSAYGKLLTELSEKNVRFIRGGTSNPAVIHISQKIGRPIFYLTCSNRDIGIDSSSFSRLSLPK